jgi:predicted nucleic acid-binding protein
VIDANVGLALVLPLAYSDEAAERLRDWMSQGESLAAPALWSYEIASALRSAQLRGILEGQQVNDSLDQLLLLGVEQIAPSLELHRRALGWAERLEQPTAYDAQYLAVAEAFQANLWTADRRLVNRAQEADVPWVRWIGEAEE